MFSNIKPLSISVSLLFLAASLLSPFFVTPVSANPVEGQTTLYFKKLDLLGEDPNVEYDSSGMFVLLSETQPTKQNDSTYPPNLINGLQINSEEWIAWLSIWMIYLFDELDGFDGFSDEWDDLLDGYGLFLPHPLRIVEAYEYTGNETIELNGTVTFDLYFSSKFSSNWGSPDNVSVGVYYLDLDSMLPLPVEIKNKTAAITSGTFHSITQQSITLDGISHSLKPGQLLLFSAEIIPGNKTLISLLLKERPILEQLARKTLQFLEGYANKTGKPALEDLFTLIDYLQNLTEEFNLTKSDLAEIFTSAIAHSLVYDSVNHPSAVTVPFEAEGAKKENQYTYYLHGNKTMDESEPTESDPSTIDLMQNTGIWTGIKLPRNKILKQATAIIYLKHKDYHFFKEGMSVTATLSYNGKTIASSKINLEKTMKFSSSVKPYEFIFTLSGNTEISHGKALQLQVALQNETSKDLFRSLEMYYDADQYPSKLSVTYEETDHITVTGEADPTDTKIIPGDTVTYTLQVKSELTDTINVTIKNASFSKEEDAHWDITITPSSFNISGNSTKTVTIKLTSTYDNIKAYKEDPLTVTFIIAGKTGITTFTAQAEVSEDAVTYNIIILTPPDKQIVHGTNDTYSFIIKNGNTGHWPDDYNIYAESEHGWTVKVEPEEIRNLSAGGEKIVNVTISVPKGTKITSDRLNITVFSRGSGITADASVKTTVIVANVFEEIYEFFQSLAKDLGFNEVFGSFAAHALGAIILIIIFFILIIMVFILTTRYADIICTDRIREINPDEKAEYRFVIKNPTKKTQTYEFQAEVSPSSEKWRTTLSSVRAVVPPKQSKTVDLIVEPTDKIEEDDWTEILFKTKTMGKRKIETMKVMAALKEAKVDLSVEDVYHWPTSFSPGEKVSTSFKVKNKGALSSSKINISFLVNGKEKNKVEDIVIPAGGYASVTIPWIAEKGKNEINIQVSQ